MAKGLSQEETALIAELDRAYVGNLERGKVNATLESLDKLANALTVSVSRFFSELPVNSELPKPLKGGRKPSN